MATIVVKRPKLSIWEKMYFPAILTGLRITLGHAIRILRKTEKVTMQYPEEKWDAHLPDHYRGAPALVTDEHGRERCVSCQLCEFVCPPKAIRITPGAVSADHPESAHIEKAPKEFEIDMLRCIYCGMCEEACPEQAIFMSHNYLFTPTDKTQAIHNKAKLYELGGTRKGLVNKWNQYK